MEIPVPSGLYQRFVRMEWERAKRVVTQCMVALEIEVEEKVYQVVRFDNAHGVFHRHLPGFPEPKRERILLDHLAPNHWIAYARDEILKNYQVWETIVLENIVLPIERVGEEEP